MKDPALRIPILFGLLDLLSVGLIAFGVFHALPARWWPVDTVAAGLCLLLTVAGAGLITRSAWSRRLARIASFVSLAIGLLLFTALALTASYLGGIYGPVGRGGAVILILVAALVLPYLVGLPVAQLLWLGPPAPSSKS